MEAVFFASPPTFGSLLRDLRRRLRSFFNQGRSVPAQVGDGTPYTAKFKMRSLRFSQIRSEKDMTQTRRVLEKDVREFGGTATIYLSVHGRPAILTVTSMPGGQTCTIFEETDVMGAWGHSLSNPVS